LVQKLKRVFRKNILSRIFFKINYECLKNEWSGYPSNVVVRNCSWIMNKPIRAYMHIIIQYDWYVSSMYMSKRILPNEWLILLRWVITCHAHAKFCMNSMWILRGHTTLWLSEKTMSHTFGYFFPRIHTTYVLFLNWSSKCTSAT
jgi:hypothetical protein